MTRSTEKYFLIIYSNLNQFEDYIKESFSIIGINILVNLISITEMFLPKKLLVYLRNSRKSK